DPTEAHVFVGIQTSRADEGQELARAFTEAGFRTVDLTEDELGKLHLRHMVGGNSPLARNERLYSFEFPERPGALMRFLSSMSPNWNISLFHYRYEGAGFGHVLVGLQVPPEDTRALRAFLATLGYPHRDESANPAYRLFLGAGT
ncbi:MAG TPA: threonine ammonia-lyase, biosynthetic, partial [Miltoncostaeaceae bacterium]|nr:threonine ammonia-lyase, biosynthetic [Miltoncostaeaceae bacterium]